MAMFDSLSERLQGVFEQLSSKGRLTEEDVDAGLKEVRLALLAADVNFKIAKDFVASIREKAVGGAVLQALNPGQQVIKIVYDELVTLLGAGAVKLNIAQQPPTIVMMVGLQGSGKTTTTAKLALYLRKSSGQRPLLVAADIYRPAAVAQLESLGKQLGVPVYSEPAGSKPLEIVHNALQRAQELGLNMLIIDTAGRLNIDEMMMNELVQIRDQMHPHETLLVVDAMTGQEAVRVAKDFAEQVGISGIVMTKMDGDARGGAALSVRSVTGVPIKFIGTGEKADALEQFYPDRVASRILGMGDVLTLIEKAQSEFDEKQALELQAKMRKGTYDLENFLEQMRQIKRMGSITDLLGMIPGLGGALKNSDLNIDNDDLKHIEAIILSMTTQERRDPDVITASRRKRIAKGSGSNVHDVNVLLDQFKEMRKMMKQLTGNNTQRGLGNIMRMMKQKQGGDTRLPFGAMRDEEGHALLAAPTNGSSNRAAAPSNGVNRGGGNRNKKNKKKR